MRWLHVDDESSTTHRNCAPPKAVRDKILMMQEINPGVFRSGLAWRIRRMSSVVAEHLRATSVFRDQFRRAWRYADRISPAFTATLSGSR
jgi:hypothetical protein